MATTDLKTFIHAVDKAIAEAQRRGVEADKLEMVLQKRAQDMREDHAKETDG